MVDLCYRSKKSSSNIELLGLLIAWILGAFIPRVGYRMSIPRIRRRSKVESIRDISQRLVALPSAMTRMQRYGVEYPVSRYLSESFEAQCASITTACTQILMSAHD